MNALLPMLLTVLGAAGGVIEGRVVYPPGPPPPRELPVHVNHSVCGRAPVFAEDLVVASDGALANVVLSVEGSFGPPQGELPALKLEQQGCVFGPHVQSATRGAILDIGNSDPVIHNVHGLVDGRTVFNLAMPIPGIRVKRTLSVPGVVAIQCDSGHDWMSAYVHVFEHALHATTGRDGRFRIEGVPPGRHRVRAWHERLGVRFVDVEVTAGEARRVELTFTDAQPVAEPEPDPEPEPEPAASAGLDPVLARAAGRTLFVRHCATCHGVRGDGRGETVRYLGSFPRDFRNGTYMFRSTASGRIPTERDLVRSIALGLPGTDMPAFAGRLSSDELALVARYLMTLSPRFVDEAPGPVVRIPRAPPATGAMVEAGRALYERLRCAQCHGAAGDGEDAENEELEDDWGHPIVSTDLTRGVFKGGRDPRALYRTLSTGLDGTPMPSFADVLTPDERWRLVYYVLSLEERGLADYLLGR